ncbi:hypothetical protein GGI06_004135 [Coemansia sp. S85]|nr:hypothetical protein GGI06_004135 [Coemansia sp. S85]
MFCAICCDSLFNNVARDKPGLVDGNQIAALKCGHTFHLDCITSWHSHDSNRSCPLCKARHIGPALLLHIECDKEHVSDQEGKNLEIGKLFISDRAREIGVHCILFLDSAERLESKCDELKSELAVLQIELDGESDHSKDRQASEGAVTEKSAGLEKLANTPSALLAAHKAHIRFVCNSPDFKETITDLEKKISESDSVSK